MGSLVLSRWALVLVLLLAGLLGGVPRVAALWEPISNVRFIPEIVEIHRVGETFTVALVVEDAYNLSGLDIKVSWNDTLLGYVSHTQTAGVLTFPAPNPPSPYSGIIYEPILRLQDTPVSTAGTYWAAFATLGGPSFNGSGTVFVMTFMVLKQPPPDGEDAIVSLHLGSVNLARSTLAHGGSIPHNTTDGIVIIHPLPTHELTVLSRRETTPLAGVPFTIDGEPRVMPYTEVLPEDSYTLVVPEAYSGYNWSYWLEDGDTNRTKTINLDANMTWTSLYGTPTSPPEPPPPGSPIGGTTFSSESEYFSSWLASTLLIASLVAASGVYIKQKKLR